jgi:hypothetical protein
MAQQNQIDIFDDELDEARHIALQIEWEREHNPERTLASWEFDDDRAA